MKSIISRRNIFALIIVVTFSISANAGGRSLPVVNYENNAVPSVIDNRAATVWDVKRAVLKAAARKGWRPITDGTDNFRLQLDDYRSQKYKLLVDVFFDKKSYSFKYVSSVGLNYKEKDGQAVIHSSYVRWMQDLVRDINAELGIGTATTAEPEDTGPDLSEPAADSD